MSANTDYSRPYHTIEKRLFNTGNFFRLLPFLVGVKLPCEQGFLSGMALAFVKMFVWLVSRVVGLNNFGKGSVKRNIGITTFLPEPFFSQE